MAALLLDPSVVASVVSGIAGGSLVALANHLYARRRERERADEALSAKFVELRLPPYTALMQSLSVISTDRMREATDEGRRAIAGDTATLLHNAIYGSVGLLASTGTREVILCGRSRCIRYAANECTYELMMDAIWAIHQMLRSDLNHRQEEVEREIDRIRASGKQMQAKQEAIEQVIRTMPHVRWPRAGQPARD